MKKIYLALLLTVTFTGSSLAQTIPSAVTTARTISSALQLNEAQYLKIKNLESARLKETKAAGGEDAAINKKYAAALLEVLTPAQQKAFQVFGKEHPTVQIAQVQ